MKIKTFIITTLLALSVPFVASATLGDLYYGSTTYPYTVSVPIGSNGNCWAVVNNLPAWSSSCGSGGGVGTSTNPFMASYFVATSTTAYSTFPNLTQGIIGVQHQNGSIQWYNATSTTTGSPNAAGILFNTLYSSALPGDDFFISTSTDIGSSSKDLSLGGTAGSLGVSLYGNGTSTAVIYSSQYYDGVNAASQIIVTPGNNSTIANLSIIGNNPTNTYDAPIGNTGTGANGVVVRNVYTNSPSDGIFINASTPSSYDVSYWNCQSMEDCVNWGNGGGGGQLYISNSRLNSFATASNPDSGTYARGIVNARGKIYSTNNLVYADNGTSQDFAYFGGANANAQTYIYGGVASSSPWGNGSPSYYDIDSSYATANTVYNPAQSFGVNYLDSGQILYSIAGGYGTNGQALFSTGANQGSWRNWFPFTKGTFGTGVNTSATTTIINDTGGLVSTASSTISLLTSITSTTTTLCLLNDICRTTWPASSGTVNSGMAGENAYYASAGTAISGTSDLWFSGSNVGVGSSTPWGILSVAVPTYSATAPMFAIGSSTATATSTPFIVNNNGYVGIASSSPFALLSLQASSSPSTPVFVIASTTNGSIGNELFVASNGTTGFGTSSPESQLDIESPTFMNTALTLSAIGYKQGFSGSNITWGNAAYGSLGIANTTNGGLGITGIANNTSNVEQGILMSGDIQVVNVAGAAGFELNANSISGGSTNTLGTAEQIVLFANHGTTESVITQNGSGGFGTSTPWGQLAVDAPSPVAATLTPLIDVATTTGSVYQPVYEINSVGHIFGSTTQPTVSSGDIYGTDFYGRVVGCASTCTVTFYKAYTTIPVCIVQPEAGSVTNTFSFTPSTTGLSVTETSLGTFDYQCYGQ